VNVLPYVEICGITERGQAESIRNRVRRAGLEDVSDRRLVFGVMASRQTVIRSKPNDMPHRYPRSEQLASLVTQSNPMDPIEMRLHYEDSGKPDPNGEDGGASLFDRVSFAVEACLTDDEERVDGVGGLWGLQLNVPWPEPEQVKKIAAEFPITEITLQIGPEAMAKYPPGSPMFYEAIDSYSGKVNGFMLDFSNGTGTNIELRKATDILCALRDEYPLLGFGVAGGLCAERVYEAANLLCLVPRLSVSMLSAIRIPTDGGGILDIDRAVDAANSIFTLTTMN